MDRSISLVFVLSVVAGVFTFVGTLVLAPDGPSVAARTAPVPAYDVSVRQLAARGDWRGVSRESRRVIDSEPLFGTALQEALLFRAIASERLERPERAAEMWTRLAEASQSAIELGSQDPSQWHYLGWALNGLGDGPGARDAFRQLAERMGEVDLESSGLLDVYNAACYLALAGREDEALDALDVVIDRAIRNPRARRFDFDWMLVDPDLDGLRDHERYIEAVRRYERSLEVEIPT